jgi:hypothetical protein
MKPSVVVAVVLISLISTSVAAGAGPRTTLGSPMLGSFKPNRSVPFRGRHPRAATVIILPYTAAYLFPPHAVVSSRYFCLYHNEAFVSRIGMIDHLSGMHDLPLATAASICPDADGECVFPHYWR